MIIDIHAHTSNHKMLGLHSQTASIDDLEMYAKKYNIEKIVLMATYFPFKGTGLSNYELLKRIQGKDLFLMFGSLDISSDFEKGLNELEELARDKKIFGIKLYPGYQIFDCADKNIFPIYELARKYNYGVLSMPKNFFLVDKKFSDFIFILSYLGNPYFDQLQEVMRECLNVYTDISGQFVSATDEDTPGYREVIKKEIEKFLNLSHGIDRIMFGTDFPIQSYKDSLEIIDSLNLSDLDKDKILYQNAKKLLKL